MNKTYQELCDELEKVTAERDAAKEDASDWEVIACRFQEERDALAAHMSRNTALMNRLFRCDDYSDNGEGEGTTDGLLVPADLVANLADLSMETPDTSLARLIAEKQAEALGKVLAEVTFAVESATVRGHLRNAIRKLERQAEGRS